MRRQLVPAVMMTLAMIVITGLLYPLALWSVGKVALKDRADGSFVTKAGAVVGSSLIGQNFTEAKYFHPRPSAAGADGYDGLSSGASNLGPGNPDLLKTVEERIAAYRAANGLSAAALVPVDAVTASSSGLDPAISVANARIQARRVAAARAIPLDTVLAAVARHTEGRAWGFLGETAVNVLELNLDLDRLGP